MAEWVKWSDIDYEELADKLVASILKDPVSSIVGRVNSLQSEWPAHKRRKIHQLQQVPKLLALVHVKLDALREAANKEPEKIIVKEEVKIQRDPKEVVDEMPTLQLMLYLFQRIWGEMKDQTAALARIEKMLLNGSKPTEVNGTTNGVPHHVVPNSKKLMRITILGLMKSQFLEVQAACDGLADLRYADRGSDSNPREIPTADHVIVMKRFIHHSHQNKVYEKFKRDDVTLLDGTVSNAIEKVRALVKGYTPVAV